MAEKRRPVNLKTVTRRFDTDHGHMFITITYKIKHKPFEIFTHIGKADPCVKAWLEALARAITTGICHGVPASEYATQLHGIQCQPVPYGQGFIGSPADALSLCLREFIGNGFSHPEHHNIGG